MSGVLHGVIASLKAAAAAVTDAFFEYVSLLLNTSATNGAQNNTFLDSSTNNFTVTRNGDTTQGSFNPYMPSGYWSGYFDGTGDELTLTNSAALSPGTGDFTIECWVYPTGSLVNANFFVGYQSGIAFGCDGSGNLTLGDAYIATIITTTTPPPLNAWSHVAAVRSGTTVSLYLNGTRIGTATSSADLTTSGTNYIGSNGNTAGRVYYTGYISNMRLVKGTAVYDPTLTTLTVPTTPLTAITNTSLLCLQDNRFKDNSTNNFTITRNGDTRISKFAPFNPPASYSTASYGGSGYFDGWGDWLNPGTNAAFAFGTGDFTVEAFVCVGSSGAGPFDIYDGRAGTTGSINGFSIYVISNSIRLDTNVAGIMSGGSVPTNVWTHVAVTRAAGTWRLFVDGVQVSTTTASYNLTDQYASIGAYNGTLFFNGYLSNVRLVKGTAVYTAAFTPPTTPLTAITNTSLLLNFTNAGIFDATTINDGQTVGNAQVSTTQAKFGTTSMGFDGTGDYLTVIDKPELRFGTAPFTIEGWVYLNVINATQGIASKRNATPTGWFLQVSSSNKLQLTFDASTLASTASLAASNWYYFALVREGIGTNQTKLYINGVNDGTGTVTNNFSQTDALAVGSDRGSGSYLNGYLQDLRITNGYARYTANFTPPTAAFPTL